LETSFTRRGAKWCAIPEEIEFCNEKSSLQRAPSDFARINSKQANNFRMRVAQLAKRKTQKSSGLATFCARVCKTDTQNSRRARFSERARLPQKS
jgi:hypothetical protein